MGVFVWRYPVLDVNCTLITGTERAVLVDTLSGPSQGRELAAGVRKVTALPVVVVNTHAHFDHCFGNAAVRDALGVTDFYAHPSVAERLGGHDAHSLAEIAAAYGHLDEVMATELPGIELHAPGRDVTGEVRLGLGGRSVLLRHVGHAHSPGDVVVFADDVAVMGDIVEEGAEPQTGDADLDGWTRALDALAPRLPGIVVPGHGALVDPEFVTAQSRRLTDRKET
ncbi:MBL fold metallo-hydrolase [Phytomonospora endophytica]|uniref:Glyoxylase-like metal-dependent hydrolase (Beta-lactamase superfamily II) n=1 Tax=Phytomonospora endophytica TaxID=714109 RepID=A0A841FE62_9ACTN|nr:MBL fold metallo-hydrolase [Phytomonospora endophytica]MBB6033805.1 glyoxylase-like metal-dependent hydrolase (beta-lactamase superfamily II) [Phytomonospora endophytica]GIG64677.1 MBL fold metallo-hydrolase [Phytomonospora endophytica]